jgi:hypothetical protein
MSGRAYELDGFKVVEEIFDGEIDPGPAVYLPD